MKLYLNTFLFSLLLFNVPSVSAFNSFWLADPAPDVSSANYNAATGELLVNGSNFEALTNDIDPSKIKIIGSGGVDAAFVLNSINNFEIIDAVSFKIILTETDRTQVNSLLNRNGTSAWDNSLYYIIFENGWNPGTIPDNPDDTGNINVTGVQNPTLIDATYDSGLGILTLNGTYFQSVPGDDIDVTHITLSEGTLYYPLSLSTPNVEITNSTTASITVSPNDRVKLNGILNNDGNYSVSGGNYKIQLSSGWNGLSEAELLGKQLNVFNYKLPVLNSILYNATSDILTFTGENFASSLDVLSDINPASITIFGGNTENFALINSYNVKVSNPNSFFISLSGTDITSVNGLFNRNGNISFQGTSYSVHMSNGWNSPVSGNISSTVTDVTISGVLSAEVESAIYDFSTGNLNITGKNLVELSGNDIDVTRITLSNGLNSYTLTNASANVNINNATSAFVNISGIDRAMIGNIFDKDGVASIDGGIYNIAVVGGWNGLGESDVSGNPVQVNNFALPSISSVLYNAGTGTLTITGNNFASSPSATDDINPSKFTISSGIYSYTISSSASNVEVTSNTAFSFILSATDRLSVNNILNWNGTQSRENALYNFAASDDWNFAANASLDISVPVNGIAVSDVPNYAPLATNVSIAGNIVNSSILTLSKTYLDYEGDDPGNSIIKWYSYADNAGSDKILIDEFSGLTYSLRSQDIGRYINAEFTPVALTGTLTGITVSSNFIGPVQNAVPVASSPTISGNRYLNQKISGKYIYFDLEGDTEGTSIFRWYRSDGPTSEEVLISTATDSTYVISSADLGKYLSFEVEPVTSLTNSTGIPVRSIRYEVLNAAPVATLMPISGSFRVGQVIRGEYTYSDLEGDDQSNSAFYWYRATNSSGANKIQISSNTRTYVIQKADLGKYFSFEVVPAAQEGTISGIPTASEFLGPVDNSAPVASNVRIASGTQAVCKTLHGDYDYSDVDGDEQGATTFQWYTSSTISGEEKAAITNATGRDYTLTKDDQGKYIFFEVIPRAISGNTTGTSTFSNSTGAIINLLPTVTFSGSASICDGTNTKLTLSFTGTAPWDLTYTDGTDQFDLRSNDYVYMLTVNKGGTYKGLTLSDNINCPVTTLTSSATVEIIPLPETKIVGLNSAYNLRGNPVPLTGSPAGGTFSGPGVISSTNMFYPSIAGTQSSPHTIIYEYRSQQTGCTNRDTTIVEVIDADASMSGIRKIAKYCNFDQPFTITATNYVGQIGTFAISYGNGLTDNHNNTATLNPGLLNAGTYTISYTYNDGIALTIYQDIVIEVLDEANIFGINSSQYCQNITPIEVSGNYSGGEFKGNSIYENKLTNKFYFTPSIVKPGSTNILYSYTTSYGCVLSKSVDKTILSVPNADFSVKDICYNGDSTSFKNLSTYSDAISTWAWRFGDVQSSEINNRSDLFEPKHKYPSIGNRTIRLIAENVFGCRDTMERIIYLGDIPKAKFNWSTECLEKGIPISFKSTSTGVDQLVDFKWDIEDTSKLDFIYKGNEILHTFPVLRNYKVSLKVISEYNCSDSITQVVSLRPIYSLKDSSYFNNFEKGKGFWYNADSLSVNNWYYGTPSGTKIKSAYSGTSAFYTSLKDIRKNLQLVISSPCFDFTEIKRPFISMQTFSNATFDQEGAVLQYTKDSGNTWGNVGTYNTGVNWFNNYSILSQPGGQQIGWSGTNSTYVNSSYPLDFLMNEPRVQFRIAFGENSKTSGTDGFAVDDIIIGNRDKKVLIEHFTNNSQSASLSANVVVDNVAEHRLNDAISVQYHTSFPGIDSLSLHNLADPGARVLYYGIGYPPISLLQGGTQPQYVFNYTPEIPKVNDVDVLALTPTSFDLKLNANKNNDKISGSVDIMALEEVINKIVSLHIVVVEDIKSQVNGTEVVYRNVVKKMLPSAGGTPYNRTWAKGNTETVNFTWDYRNVFNPQNIRLVAFLQDETSHEIYQVDIDTNSLIDGIGNEPIKDAKWEALVFPNPAGDWLNIDFPEVKDPYFKLQIISLNGKLVWEDSIQKGVTRYEMTTENLKNGVYFVRILNKKNVMSINKLVIVH